MRGRLGQGQVSYGTAKISGGGEQEEKQRKGVCGKAHSWQTIMYARFFGEKMGDPKKILFCFASFS